VDVLPLPVGSSRRDCFAIPTSILITPSGQPDKEKQQQQDSKYNRRKGNDSLKVDTEYFRIGLDHVLTGMARAFREERLERKNRNSRPSWPKTVPVS
jgi:hypothetical protein